MPGEPARNAAHTWLIDADGLTEPVCKRLQEVVDVYDFVVPSVDLCVQAYLPIPKPKLADRRGLRWCQSPFPESA
jgi:hypothetical protein